MEYSPGERVIYTRKNVIVEIIRVHYDDSSPYYTIKISNGREIQTISKYLSKTKSNKTRRSHKRRCVTKRKRQHI